MTTIQVTQEQKTNNINEWLTIREQVLVRDGNTCSVCSKQFSPSDLHVHHIKPRSDGGTDSLDNLTTLCQGHHAAEHPSLQVKLARRFIERWAIRIAKLVDDSQEVRSVTERLTMVLREFGHNRFRSGQLDVILPAIAGKSVLYVSPTGSGKTLCFQLPALLKNQPTYVIEPLRALMADQVQALMKLDMPASYIDSGIVDSSISKERTERYEMLAEGYFKLFYITPERLDEEVVGNKEVQLILKNKPAYLVVDEAHCVPKWGVDFRPSFNKLNNARKELGSPPVLAFTATAGTEVQDKILEQLGISDAVKIIRDVDRPNIALFRKEVSNRQNRNIIIADLLKHIHEGKVMIFVPSRPVGNDLKEFLSRQDLDIDVPFYHGKLSEKERINIQNKYSRSEAPCNDFIICTNAFGMGIDIPNVRLVIHWQPPGSIEDYAQEFGRAGRDGNKSLALVFHGDDGDDERLDYLVRKSLRESKANLSDSDKRTIYESRKRDREDFFNLLSRSDVCFRQRLVDHFGSIKTKRRLGIKLLSFVFEERVKLSNNRVCCDGCNDFASSKGNKLLMEAINQPVPDEELKLFSLKSNDYILPFGKYKGKSIYECDKNYLRWLARGGVKGSFRASQKAVETAKSILPYGRFFSKRKVRGSKLASKGWLVLAVVVLGLLGGWFMHNTKVGSDQAVMLLIAHQDAWVQVVSEEKVLYEGTLKSGSNLELSSKEDFRLWIGNAGGVKISCNGKSIEPLGKNGQVIKDYILSCE